MEIARTENKRKTLFHKKCFLQFEKKISIFKSLLFWKERSKKFLNEYVKGMRLTEPK